MKTPKFCVLLSCTERWFHGVFLVFLQAQLPADADLDVIFSLLVEIGASCPVCDMCPHLSLQSWHRGMFLTVMVYCWGMNSRTGGRGSPCRGQGLRTAHFGTDVFGTERVAPWGWPSAAAVASVSLLSAPVGRPQHVPGPPPSAGGEQAGHGGPRGAGWTLGRPRSGEGRCWEGGHAGVCVHLLRACRCPRPVCGDGFRPVLGS